MMRMRSLGDQQLPWPSMGLASPVQGRVPLGFGGPGTTMLPAMVGPFHYGPTEHLRRPHAGADLLQSRGTHGANFEPHDIVDASLRCARRMNQAADDARFRMIRVLELLKYTDV